MKYKAVIFDMDGVIIDSEPYQSQAYETVIREYDKEPFLLMSGLSIILLE
jgi:beta-phosphoglucomutase-like phosphatase (HAD superfamily)